MGLITRNELNTEEGRKDNIDTIYEEFNGRISNENVVDDADIEMSKLENAIAWTTWTPTYGASGAMTWGTITTAHARYCQIGKVVFFDIIATGTTADAASDGLTFTLPSTPTNASRDACFTYDNLFVSGIYYGNAASADITVKKYNNSNFGIGANRGFGVKGFYEV